MNPIRSKNSNEHIQGIKDHFGITEDKANTIAKQVFENYGYNPIKLDNFNNKLFSGSLEPLNDRTDHGIDAKIFKDKIPDDDPFNLSQLKKGRSCDMFYTIDYKSNNFKGGSDSIYIKLMPYRGIKNYLPSYTESNGKIIEPLYRNMKRDYRKCKRESKSKNRRSKKKSMMEHYYGNNQLLGDNNRTDYFFYMKYNKFMGNNGDEILELVSAYLVPAEQLRYQVIGILNKILKKGYDHPIKLREDGLYLNHKIRHALRICDESPELIKPEVLKPPMDLFKPKYKEEIHLRIPEKYLTPHIKLDAEGDIIN